MSNWLIQTRDKHTGQLYYITPKAKDLITPDITKGHCFRSKEDATQYKDKHFGSNNRYIKVVYK